MWSKTSWMFLARNTGRFSIGRVKRKFKKRRKIGVVESAKSAIMDTAVIVGGAAVGTFVINKAVDMGKTIIDLSKYEGIIQTVLGVAGATLIKNNLGKQAFQGVAAAGIVKILLQYFPRTQSVAGVKLIAGILQGGSKLGALPENIKTLINQFYNNKSLLTDTDLYNIINNIGSSGLGYQCGENYLNLQTVRSDVQNEITRRSDLALQQQQSINANNSLRMDNCIAEPAASYNTPEVLNPYAPGGSLYNTSTTNQSDSENTAGLSYQQTADYYNNKYNKQNYGVFGLGVIR